MKKVVLVFLLCVSGLHLKGQISLDSLYSVWQDPTQPDSVRVATYCKYIHYGYIFTKPDSALVLTEDLHRYAKEHNYPGALGSGYSMQGMVNHVQGNYSRALEYHLKSLALREELGDKKGISVSLSNIGNIYVDQGNYPRALEHHLKSLAIREELGDKKGISVSLGNIGNIYISQRNYSRALEYYEESLAIMEELGDKTSIPRSLSNVGSIYYIQGNYPRALEYYEKSLAYYKEIWDKNGFAIALGNIGNIYSSQRNYLRAQEYYEKALAIQEELGDKLGIASSMGSIGSNFQEQGKAKLALYYCQRGLALAEEIGALRLQKNAFNCLYDTYKAMGRGNEALEYLEKLRVVEDSLNAQETAKKLEQMEFAKVMLQDSLTKAEEARLVQESHQTEVRKKNKVRNVFMGSSFFLLLIAGGFYSRWRYVRKSRDIISKEKDRSENLLLNILPAEIAAELKEKGRAEARDFDLVSILFTDFKEFTRASEKLSAQELVSEINACFEAFDVICERYNIEKIKTIGDAYMAAGGLPVPSEDSVVNTVRAALEMQAFINQRKAENEAAGLPAFEMRVGIHTGPVVAGIVGVKKFQYDIWGDTVNTAARMESSGEVGQVNISEATYELVKDQFECTYRGEVEAKGKGRLGMYFVG